MEINKFENCPTCGAKITDGIFKSNQIISKHSALLIKEYVPDAKDNYCTKCHIEPYSQAKIECGNELRLLGVKIKELIGNITVASVHSPMNWDYDILGMVTGQSTTGTGVLSEFTSSITDFFGMQSGAYNQKIAKGEELCQAQIKLKCLNLGGNAIIATDIDYAEVGGAQGMLLVCMTGTAIKLKNTDILGEAKSSNLVKLEQAFMRKKYLDTIAPKDAYQQTQNNTFLPH